MAVTVTQHHPPLPRARGKALEQRAQALATDYSPSLNIVYSLAVAVAG